MATKTKNAYFADLMQNNKCNVNDLADLLGFGSITVRMAFSGQWMPSAKFIDALCVLWDLDYEATRKEFEKLHKIYGDTHPGFVDYYGYYHKKGWLEAEKRRRAERYERNKPATAPKKKGRPKKAAADDPKVIKPKVTTTEPQCVKPEDEHLSSVADIKEINDVAYWQTTDAYKELCNFLYGKISYLDFAALARSRSYVEAMSTLYGVVDCDSYMKLLKCGKLD